MATPEEIRRAREATAFGGLLNNFFATNRAYRNRLAQQGRRPVLGGLLSKEPVMGTDTLRYEGIRPFIGNLLEPVIKGVDASRAASQDLIPQEDMVGEALGTAGTAMLGGGAVAKPAGSLGANTLRVYHGGPKRLSASEVEMRPDPEGTPIGFSVTDNPDVAEYYRNMRGGGSISEFDIDLDKANIISERELYDFIEDLEDRLDADASYEQIQRGLLDAGIDAIEYPDPEFGIRVVDPNILGANASKSAGLLSVASDVSARGDQILNMLKSGRGSEVTDPMLDMGDSVKNTQLNQYLAENYDLPLDEASRLARAREMGLLDAAYHSTGRDFQNFVPSEFRGASFFAATPEGASKGASASANEGVGSGSKVTMPVRVDTSGVEGLGAYARKDMNEFRASLPDRIYTEAEVDALMASDAAPLRGNWSDFFDDLTDYDALRKFRDENPTKEIPDGIVKFRPKRPKSYNKDLKTNLSGGQFAHYSEGMSERPTSEYVRSQGNTGFTMMDESGLALAMVDPTKVRSQFARFDPRLSHLSNVTAANASKPVGLLVLEQQARGNNRLGGLLESQGMDISDLSTASPTKIQSALDTAVKRGILDPRSAAGLKRGILDGL